MGVPLSIIRGCPMSQGESRGVITLDQPCIFQVQPMRVLKACGSPANVLNRKSVTMRSPYYPWEIKWKFGAPVLGKKALDRDN